MTSFFVLINGFEARVRPQVRVQSLPCASKQLGNDTILLPAALMIIAASCVTEGDVTELFGASNSSVTSPSVMQLAAIIIRAAGGKTVTLPSCLKPRCGVTGISSGSSLRELCFANERHPEDRRVRKRLGSRPA